MPSFVPMTPQVEYMPVPGLPRYSDNQICQWYCCECGQSYGQIMYRDRSQAASPNSDEGLAGSGDTQFQFLPSTSSRSSSSDTSSVGANTPPDASENHRGTAKLTEHSAISTDISSDNHSVSYTGIAPITEKPPYTDLLQSIKHYSQMVYSNLSTPELHHSTSNNYTTEFSLSRTPPPHTILLSPHSSQTNLSDSESVELKVPTRYTCRRCNHMMCPYCPKVRYKDLPGKSSLK